MATVMAPPKTDTASLDDERTLIPGSVWSVEFIRVKPGRGLEYARMLADSFKKMLDENQRQGIVLSYKIFTNAPSDRDDFTHLFMVEFPNFAALDQRDKMDTVTKKTVGSLAKLQDLQREREEVREIIGSRLVREVHFK